MAQPDDQTVEQYKVSPFCLSASACVVSCYRAHLIRLDQRTTSCTILCLTMLCLTVTACLSGYATTAVSERALHSRPFSAADLQTRTCYNSQPTVRLRLQRCQVLRFLSLRGEHLVTT